MDERVVSNIAASRHGVFTIADLERAGMNRRQARRRIVTGRWRELHPGVYVVAGIPESFDMRATAALASHRAAVLSHCSAGRVLGIRDSDDLVLSVPIGARHLVAGAIVHQTSLPSRHVTRRHGFVVTTIERTLVDLAVVLSQTELERCVEDQLVARVTTVSRLEDTFAEVGGRGRGGSGRMRSALTRLDGDPPTESELEAMFWRLLERNSLPLPQRQVELEWLPHGRGRVDFWYQTHSLVVELDGRRFHERSAAFETDRRRDQQALIAGVRTVRFTHRQLTAETLSVVAVMRQLLSGARPSDEYDRISVIDD